MLFEGNGGKWRYIEDLHMDICLLLPEPESNKGYYCGCLNITTGAGSVKSSEMVLL